MSPPQDTANPGVSAHAPVTRGAAIPFSVATLGIATFACMDALMKGLATNLGAYNTLFWRSCIALSIAGALFLLGRRRWPARAVIRIHLLRGVITALMAFLFFWGLIYVPLAEAIGLSFIAPLIALYLAAVLLGEKIGGKSIFASCMGLLGTVVIVAGKLGGDYDQKIGLGIAAILLSALFYAYNLILQRQQALLAHPFEIAFFQNLTVFTIYLVLAPFLATPPPTEAWTGLTGVALLGIVSMLLLSWAYARAEAKILIPVEYTAFIWAALLGAIFFDEAVTLPTLAGTALIVTGCLVAAQQGSDKLAHVETTAV